MTVAKAAALVLIAAGGLACGQSTAKILERIEGGTPPSSNIRMDVFLLRAVSSCAVGPPCASSNPDECFFITDAAGARISFDPDSRTAVESCNAASSRPSAPLIRRVRLTALMTAVEPQQPCYLSHIDATAAAPVDGVPYRQTLIVGHHPQRLPGAPLSVPDQSIAFTECGQHRDR